MADILVLDFDGVIHSYTSKWVDAKTIPDPPVEGAMVFLSQAVWDFDVCIYSSRSHQEGGIMAMREYIHFHLLDKFSDTVANEILAMMRFPTSKPSAFITIDDRAITFEGVWPDLEELAKFVPWNKRK